MKNFKKLLAGVLATTMMLGFSAPNKPLSNSVMNVKTTNAANGSVFNTNTTKTMNDGVDLEFWTDVSGNKASMTYTGNGGFTCQYDTTGNKNTLMRTGKKFSMNKGSGQTHKQLGQITLDYDVDYKPGSAGASYMCVYGWTHEDNGAPLVEYYVIDSWGSWRPPGDLGQNGIKKHGEKTIDGVVYEIVSSDRVNQPSIYGTSTFKQYWSIRKPADKKTGSWKSSVNMTEHFKAWEELIGPMGSLYEVSLCIEGYNSTGSATVSSNKITVGGGSTGTTTTTKAGPTVTTTTVTTTAPPQPSGQIFHDDFESGLGTWEARGDAKIAVVNNLGLNNTKGMSVSGRTSNWHSGQKPLDLTKFRPGSSYSLSGWIMQNTQPTENFKLTLQIVDPVNGDPNNYNQAWYTIAEGSAVSGEWILLENLNFTIPSGATEALIYFETDNTLTSFYVDHAYGATSGMPNPAKNNLKSTTDTTTATTTTAATTTTTLATTTTTTTVTTTLETTTTNITNTNPSNVNPTVYGDINGDGQVTIEDVVAVRLYCLKPSVYPLSPQALANALVIEGQQTVQGNCAVAIQDYVVEKIKSLPIKQ